jgi:hypothetical protein
VLQMQHFATFFLNSKSIFLVKKSHLLVKCSFGHSNPWFNFTSTSSII